MHHHLHSLWSPPPRHPPSPSSSSPSRPVSYIFSTFLALILHRLRVAVVAFFSALFTIIFRATFLGNAETLFATATREFFAEQGFYVAQGKAARINKTANGKTASAKAKQPTGEEIVAKMSDAAATATATPTAAEAAEARACGEQTTCGGSDVDAGR